MGLATQQEMENLLAKGWKLSSDNNRIEREFKLADFATAFSLRSQVAEKAEEMNHHPDWSNSYNRLKIRLTTHSLGAITTKDIELAEQIEKLAQNMSKVE